jgi:hypothetical protein
LALHVVLLDMGHARLPVGGHLRTAGSRGFRLFNRRFGPGNDAFPNVLFNVGPGQAKAGADRGCWVLGIGGPPEIDGRDHSLQTVEIGHRAFR